MTFIHFAGCPVWDDMLLRECTCPREWRVRKDDQPLAPWVVSRRDSAGHYGELLRARTWELAMSLVAALIQLGTDLRGGRFPRCPQP